MLVERERVSTRAVRTHADALAAFVASFEPAEVAPIDAPALWREFDRIERLAASAKTLLATRVEQAATWKREGYRSAAEQLARMSGTTTAAARTTLETSKRLANLPATSNALRHGALSTTQVDTIASAAVDSGAERELLQLAPKTNVTELREAALRVRAAADPDPAATHRRVHARRSVRTFTDGEGAWNLVARGTVDQGARFEAALERRVDERFNAARREARREPRETYAFDALVSLVDENAPAKKPTSNPRHLALLRVDLDALVRGRTEPGETCEIAGFGPVPVVRARELLGESILKLVLTKGVDVANVVHLGRGPTAAQRVALLWSQPKCTNEACSSTFVQIDHRTPWVATKHTVLSELDRLCHHDHALKTNQGWSLIDGKGRRAFVPPTDPRHPRNRPPPRRH